MWYVLACVHEFECMKYKIKKDKSSIHEKAWSINDDDDEDNDNNNTEADR